MRGVLLGSTGSVNWVSMALFPSSSCAGNLLLFKIRPPGPERTPRRASALPPKTINTFFCLKIRPLFPLTEMDDTRSDAPAPSDESSSPRPRTVPVESAEEMHEPALATSSAQALEDVRMLEVGKAIYSE